MRNALLRLLYFLLRAARPGPGKRSVDSVLVLQYQMPLGCCVHGTPIYAALKAARPDLTVIVATRGLGWSVLQHDPNVDHLLETDDPMGAPLAKSAVVRQLRHEVRCRGLNVDLILQDATNRRGAFALFASLLRLAPTVGFANMPALYDTHFEYDPGLSLIDNNLRLAALVRVSAIGDTIPRTRSRNAPVLHVEPSVYFCRRELESARTLLRMAHPAGGPLTALVVQGSGGQRTGWHDDRFAAVIRYIESLGHQVVFLGTAADQGAMERVRSATGSSGVSLAGRTSIPELTAVLCLCDLLITIDTGTMHVGRAADVPMVVLGPSWQKPLEWLPLDKANARILRGADREEVPEDYRLDEITVEAAKSAVDDLLLHFPPSQRERERRVQRLLSETRAD